MNQVRILFAGPRNWPVSRGWLIRDVLDRAVPTVLAARRVAVWEPVQVTLVSGHCPTGADPIAENHAFQCGWIVEPHAALWDECGPDCPATLHRIRRRAGDTAHPGVLPTYCPKAGPRRNTLMAKLGADIGVAVVDRPGWSGTRDCMAKAARADIPTTIHPWTDAQLHS